MRTTLEANKNDIIRFCVREAAVTVWLRLCADAACVLVRQVGAVASTTAVGLGILRLVL